MKVISNDTHHAVLSKKVRLVNKWRIREAEVICISKEKANQDNKKAAEMIRLSVRQIKRIGSKRRE